MPIGSSPAIALHQAAARGAPTPLGRWGCGSPLPITYSGGSVGAPWPRCQKLHGCPLYAIRDIEQTAIEPSHAARLAGERSNPTSWTGVDAATRWTRRFAGSARGEWIGRPGSFPEEVIALPRFGCRTRFLAGFAFALALAPTAAVVAAAARPLPLAQARLSAYDAIYTITGVASGNQTWQIRQGEGDTTDVTLHTRIAGQSETDHLVLSRRGLAFRSARETITAPNVEVTIAASVKGSEVAETAVVNGRVEHLSYPMTPTTYENEALLPTLSGLPLRPGERSVIHDVVLQHGGNVALGLSVGRLSTVKTRAGAFRCAAVTISSASGRQTAWVKVGPDPVLVRYANGQTTFTLTALKR